MVTIMSSAVGRPKKEVTPEEAIQKLSKLLGSRVGSALNKLEMVGRCGAYTSAFSPDVRAKIADQVSQAVLDAVKKADQGLREGRKPKPMFELNI